MKQKTAVQTYIEWLETPRTVAEWDEIDCISKAKELLELEKRQIIESRLSVTGLNHASPTDDTNMKEAEDYYNQTYSNE